MSRIFYKSVKRLLDIIFSMVALVLLVPLFIIISVQISVNSRGGIFYIQKRVGMNMRVFNLIKFRTMHLNADRFGEITIGKHDPRVTKTGIFLRKYKLDELPQLLNIFKGDMSFVGPRPEVEKYVKLYTGEYSEVLKVRPGLTDFASILFSDENHILSLYPNPEEVYIMRIMPRKIFLCKKYIEKQSLLTDLYIICKTLKKVFFNT
jgi:lipopolysaccharide/colanic/teichoic acid biosynthesis glycosyltransferase